MSKHPIAARLVTHLAVGLLAGLGAYHFGVERGRKQGEAVQREHSKLGHGINTAVYLTVAGKDEEAGNASRASSTRHRLLYGSAMDIQNAIDSGMLDPAELSESRADKVLAEVAAYFHRHPESVTPIEDEPFSKHLVPELRKLMEKHDPAGKAPGGP